MKDFLLIGNTNACTYKEFFPLLKERKVSMGVEMPKEYYTPDGTTKKFGNICWFSTLHTPDKKKLVLTKKYNHKDYPHYDNYNAIEVGRIKDIPYDYDCVMGVPITIFQYGLDNFEIMGMAAGNSAVNGFGSQAGYRKHKQDRGGCPVIDDERIYTRVLIRRKQL